MSTVYIRKTSYHREQLKHTLFDIMEQAGLSEISHGSHILLKPNFLMPAKPESAVLTHPNVLETVICYILDKGGKPVVSDSPGTGSLSSIMKTGGYSFIPKKYHITFKTFSSSVPVDIGGPFGTIDLAEDAMSCDTLINLPKLKTHVMMMMTLGVKNLFGCILGRQKAEWHLRAGIKADVFAELLTRIAHKINPSMTLIDGILSMEGQGPGKGGTPRNTEVIIGGKNVFAVDMAICKMLGFQPSVLPTHAAAVSTGLFNEELTLDGSDVTISDFTFPQQDSPVFGPPFIHGFLRKHMIRKPVTIKNRCNLCETCINHCPVDAIKHDKKELHFDYNRCIRCYCCVELCPQAALKASETLPGKVLRNIIGFKN